jgi:hypothetical protein
LLKGGRYVVSSWLGLTGRKGYPAQRWQAGSIFMVRDGRQEGVSCKGGRQVAWVASRKEQPAQGVSGRL